MAAPTKEGLDYFSFDVDLLDNDNLDFLRDEYGVVVNDVYIALLTLLYRKKGYYIPYETEAERKDCIWYIFKRVRGGKHPVQQGLIPIVIEALVAQGLFDSNLFEKRNDRCNKIITSERAQKTYYKATVERKFESFDIKPEYWLLNDETMRKLSKTHPYYIFLHSESKSDEKPSKSDEKLVKESKVNKTKEKYNNHHLLTPSSYSTDEEIEDEIDEEDDNNNNDEMNNSKYNLKSYYEYTIESIECYVDCCYHSALRDIANYCKGVEYVKVNGCSMESWKYLQELNYACRRAEDDIQFFANIFSKVGSQQNITNQRQYLMTAIYNASKFAEYGF